MMRGEEMRARFDVFQISYRQMAEGTDQHDIFESNMDLSNKNEKESIFQEIYKTYMKLSENKKRIKS